MKNRSKNWLILAHCFNMDGRAASQTITDKIPFLMEKGISPIVVSAPTGKKDKDFVHHQVFSPAPSGINFEVRKKIEQKYGKNKRSEFFKALVTIFCAPFLLFEKLIIDLDSHWSWFITAGLKSGALIRKYKPDVIYSTAGPSSTHFTGYLLKKVSHIPWIAEIHDPLIPASGRLKCQRQVFHRWLEKIIFRNADAVFYFTENACNNARNRTQIFHNSHVLRPGATPPQISGISYKKTGKIHFGHFGSLASGRNMSKLIKALHRIFEKEPFLRGKVILDVYGMPLDAQSKKTVTQLSLTDTVREHGRLEYDPVTKKTGRLQVFEKMHLCDVLLIIHGETDICNEYIPSKTYEYLLTKRPILGVTATESELGQTLLSAGHSVVVNNISDIEAAIRKKIHDWEDGQIEKCEGTNSFTVEDAVTKLVASVNV